MLVAQLPLPPNLANERTHWAVKNKRRQNYQLVAYAYLRNAGLLGKGMTVEKCKIGLHLYTQRAMDWDNAVARCKWALDALVKCKFLPDDNPDVITELAFVRQTRVKKKGDTCLEITIIPE